MNDKGTDVKKSEEQSSGASMSTIEPTAETDGMFPTVQVGIESSEPDVKKAGEDDKTKGAETIDDLDPNSEANKRIRKLNDDKKTAEADAAYWRNQAQTNQQPKKQPEPAKPDFKFIEKMPAAEVREWREEDPVGFEENQRKRNLYEMQQHNAAAKTTESVNTTFEAYGKEHDDFWPMWEDGTITAFMKENPGHNAISAHMVLTSDARTKKALEEGRAQWDKDQKARLGAKGLGAGPGQAPHVPTTNDTALKNPDKYGGESAVMLARHRARAKAG